MAEMPRRRRSRRNRFIGWAVPRLYDRPPPPWTGVPVERDPVSGKFLRGDPTGRSDKGRTRRTAGRGAAMVAGAAAVLAAVVLGAWVLGARIGGQPTPAASGTAMPSPTEAGPSEAEPTSSPSGGDSPSESTTTGSTTTTTTTTTETTTPPPATVPAAPSRLTATPLSETSIQLTWADLSTDESAFEITDGVVSLSTSADAQEFVWDGLTGGQQVCFRIRAVGDAGTSAWHPDGSPVCATTLAAQTPPDVDLRLKGIALASASAVCAGTSPTFTAALANDGTQPSGPFSVQWLLDGEPLPDTQHGSLAGFGADTSTVVVPDVPGGDHQLVAVVDPAGQIVEFDENNNTGVLAFTAAKDCVE